MKARQESENDVQEDDRWIVLGLEGLTGIARTKQDADLAGRQVSVTQALRAAIGLAMSLPEQFERERILTTIHDLLDERAFTATWAEGQAISLEQAIAGFLLFIQSVCFCPPENQPEVSTRSSRYLHKNLTQREREILRLVSQGLTNAQIAQQLVISPRTVNWHLTSIYSKLQVSSRAAAMRYVLEYHLT